MRSLRPLLVPLLLLLGACGDGVKLDSGGTPLPEGCSGAGTPDTYVQGLARDTVGGITIAFLDASPAPPDVGDNTFTMDVDAPSGSVVRVRPWMPLHGHGVTGEWVTATEAGGAWQFEDIDLFMPGLWEFVFTVDSTDKDTGALFRFCLEG